MQPTTEARRWEELPPQAQAYIRRVESLVGVPVGLVSVAPERDAVLRVP
jgi:adenylosuccinate synthase